MPIAFYLSVVFAFIAQLTTLCLSATLAWGGLPIEHQGGKLVESARVFCANERIQEGECTGTRHSDEYPGPVGWTDGPLLFSSILSLLLLIPWCKVALQFATERIWPREATLYAVAGGCLLLSAAYQIMLSQGGARQIGEMEVQGFRNVQERHNTLNAITWCSLFLFIHHAILGISGTLINRGAKNANYGAA